MDMPIIFTASVVAIFIVWMTIFFVGKSRKSEEKPQYNRKGGRQLQRVPPKSPPPRLPPKEEEYVRIVNVTQRQYDFLTDCPACRCRLPAKMCVCANCGNNVYSVGEFIVAADSNYMPRFDNAPTRVEVASWVRNRRKR